MVVRAVEVVLRESVRFWAAGPFEVLNGETTGFFCSAQCPGGVILKTFDAITAMRDRGEVAVGGFHSPMERECLGILLRGRQTVVWAPARGIAGMRLRPELREAFEAGRLAIVSPFGKQKRRVTAELAEERNRFVAGLVGRVFVAHAAAGSRTMALVQEVKLWKKAILTVADGANRALLELGATTI